MLPTTESPVDTINVSSESKQGIITDDYAQKTIINTAISAFVMFVGLSANTFVIWIYLFRQLGLKKGRYFIPFLGFADISLLLTVGPFHILDNLLHFSFPGEVLCKSLRYIAYVASFSSGGLYCIIAIQRYLLICRPLGKQLTIFWSRLSLIILLCISTTHAIPVAIFSGIDEINFGRVSICSWGSYTLTEQIKRRTYFFFATTLFALIYLVGFVFYCIIGRKIYLMYVKERKDRRNRICRQTEIELENKTEAYQTDGSVNEEGGDTLKRREENRFRKSVKLSMMFMVITLAGFMVFLTSFTLIYMESNNRLFWEKMPYLKFQYLLFLRRLYLIHHATNPLIYGFFDKAYKNELRKLFIRVFIRRR